MKSNLNKGQNSLPINLGEIRQQHLLRQIVSGNWSEVYKVTNEQAFKGDAPSQGILGMMYAEGCFVDQDKGTGHAWLVMAVQSEYGEKLGPYCDWLYGSMTENERAESITALTNLKSQVEKNILNAFGPDELRRWTSHWHRSCPNVPGEPQHHHSSFPRSDQ